MTVNVLMHHRIGAEVARRLTISLAVKRYDCLGADCNKDAIFDKLASAAHN